MCIYNIYIYIHIHLCMYIYTYRYRGYNMRSSRGPMSMNKQVLVTGIQTLLVLPNAVTFWLHRTSHEWSSQVAQLVHEQAHFRWVNVRKFMWKKSMCSCHKYVQTRLTQSGTIYLIWYQGASRSLVSDVFVFPNPIPRGTVIASKPISPSHQIWPVQLRLCRKPTAWPNGLMLDIEEPPLGSANKFSVAKVCCDPVSPFGMHSLLSCSCF